MGERMASPSMIANAPPLLQLPHEILHHVLINTDPHDLAAVARSCRTLYVFVKDNRTLFKDVYLQNLDDPAMQDGVKDVNFEKELQELVRLQKVVNCGEFTTQLNELEDVARRVSRLLEIAAPCKTSQNVALISSLFQEHKIHEAFLCNSTLFQRTKAAACTLTPAGAALTVAQKQASAKLHCLYGVPIQSCGRTRSSRTYPFACSKVYDLRNYTDETMWGPFMDDGSQDVDWEKVEAIMVVLGHNLHLFSEHTGICRTIWTRKFSDVVPNSYMPLSVDPTRSITPPPDLCDPYNVTGTYMRPVLTSTDFNDLFTYNFHPAQPASDEPRPPLDTTEAIRIIAMNLRVTRIEAPGKDDGQALPVVYFDGTSRSMHEAWDPNANSNIRGTVRLTKEGEVRWTTFSIYQGEERWRSEGIQVGGIRSARGVIGNWFDKDFGPHGPAGPTAFWKISDDVDGDRDLDDFQDSELDDEYHSGEDEGMEDEEDEEDEDEDEEHDEEANSELDHFVLVPASAGLAAGEQGGAAGAAGSETEGEAEADVEPGAGGAGEAGAVPFAPTYEEIMAVLSSDATPTTTTEIQAVFAAAASASTPAPAED